jgi:hypothetical protein
MRLWIWPTSSLEGTVMMAKVRSHSPVLGLRQFSHKPARPKGDPSFMAINKGLQAIAAEVTDYSKKSFEDGTRAFAQLLRAISAKVLNSTEDAHIKSMSTIPPSCFPSASFVGWSVL